MPRVLVIGATGDQGAAQVRELLASGQEVFAAARGASAERLPAGARPVALDLLEPDSLPAALEGVETVFLNLPSASFTDPGMVLRGFRNFLAAAEAARPGRIVFNASLYVGDQPAGHVAHDTRYQIIQQLLDSPVDATAVCPVIFMDNLLRGWAWPALRDRQVLSYPHAEDLPVSWICLADVARIMIRLATEAGAANQRFVVGGPEPLRGAETAAALSRAWGREIGFESLPVESFAHNMGELFAADDPVAARRIKRDLAAVYRWYNEARPSPFTVDMTGFLAHYPMPLRTVEDWARQHPMAAPTEAGNGVAGTRQAGTTP